MKRLIIVVLLLVVILSCQVNRSLEKVSRISPIPTVAPSQGKVHNSGPLETSDLPTSTRIPSMTPGRTPTSIYTATQITVFSLPVELNHIINGILLTNFISDNGSFGFVDFNKNQQGRLTVKGCTIFMPNSPNVICYTEESGYFLYDLITREKTFNFSSVGSLASPGSSSDGKFAYFSRYGEPMVITIFNILDSSSWEIRSPKAIGDFAPPVLSLDGLHFSALYAEIDGDEDEDIVEIIDMETHMLVDGKNIIITGPIAWSPTSQQFIYGVTNAPLDMWTPPNQIYLYDYPNGNSEYISSSPEGLTYDVEFEWNPWSPDGKMIAIPWGDGFCVVTIKPKEQECMHVTQGRITSELIWSPTSNQLAFWVKDQKSENYISLIIYNITTQKSYLLLTNSTDEITSTLIKASWIDSHNK